MIKKLWKKFLEKAAQLSTDLLVSTEQHCQINTQISKHNMHTQGLNKIFSLWKLLQLSKDLITPQQIFKFYGSEK